VVRDPGANAWAVSFAIEVIRSVEWSVSTPFPIGFQGYVRTQ